MDNKKRNQKILQLACDLLEKINCEVENAFVEDIEGEEEQVLVSDCSPTGWFNRFSRSKYGGITVDFVFGG